MAPLLLVRETARAVEMARPVLTPMRRAYLDQWCRNLAADGWIPQAIAELTGIGRMSIVNALGLPNEWYDDLRSPWGYDRERYLIRKGIIP